jgi:hypothetical protein
VVDLSKLPDITGQPFEHGQEILVESRRGLSPEAAAAGALGPASWAARIRTATALRAE